LHGVVIDWSFVLHLHSVGAARVRECEGCGPRSESFFSAGSGELDTGFPLATSAQRVVRDDDAQTRTWSVIADSKLKSFRWSAHGPSVVIRLNIVFTNFGSDKCGAEGGLLAIA